LLAPLEDEHARISAACVSLSSYYNVKEPVGVKPEPHSRTPNGSKSAIKSQRQSKRISRRPEQAPPLSDWNRAVALVSQVLRATRAEGVFRCQGFSCQEVHCTKSPGPLGIAFLGHRDNQATFLPECAATLPPVNGEVTIPGTVWLRTAEGTRRTRIFRRSDPTRRCQRPKAEIERADPKTSPVGKMASLEGQQNRLRCCPPELGESTQ
jgi:hypothetical protein